MVGKKYALVKGDSEKCHFPKYVFVFVLVFVHVFVLVLYLYLYLYLYSYLYSAPCASFEAKLGVGGENMRSSKWNSGKGQSATRKGREEVFSQQTNIEFRKHWLAEDTTAVVICPETCLAGRTPKRLYYGSQKTF